MKNLYTLEIDSNAFQQGYNKACEASVSHTDKKKSSYDIETIHRAANEYNYMDLATYMATYVALSRL